MRTMVRLFIGKFAIVTVPIFSFRKTLYKELGKRILQRILWNHIFTCSNDPYFGMRKQRTQIYDYCFLRIIYPSNEVTACWDIAMCGACFSCNSHLHYCPYLFRGIRKRLFLGWRDTRSDTRLNAKLVASWNPVFCLDRIGSCWN